MAAITRRTLLAAGGTVAVAAWPRKPRAQELKTLATALHRVDPPVAAPDIAFIDAVGKTHHLSEYRGHGVVLNLWATWCAPCVAEMPSLAALAKAVAPAGIVVLPLSADLGGATAVEAYFHQHDIAGLPVLLDPQGAAERAVAAPGIPTSILIDKTGQERGRVAGSADWSTPAAEALVRQLLG